MGDFPFNRFIGYVNRINIGLVIGTLAERNGKNWQEVKIYSNLYLLANVGIRVMSCDVHELL